MMRTNYTLIFIHTIHKSWNNLSLYEHLHPKFMQSDSILWDISLNIYDLGYQAIFYAFDLIYLTADKFLISCWIDNLDLVIININTFKL